MEKHFQPSAVGKPSLIRLRDLLARVNEQLPNVRPSNIVQGSFDFNSATVTFANGIDVLVSVDADLPEALYEVVRFVKPSDVHQYPFERRTTIGAAYNDKLSGDAVLELLKQYATAAAPTPQNSQPGSD